MGKRTLGVVAAVMLVGGLLLASPAFAVEADEDVEEAPGETELPSMDEVGTQSERAREFIPEMYEQPSLFPFMIYPLMILGGLVIVVVLVLYLRWQPHFAEERREKSRR